MHDHELVDITLVDPRIRLDLLYATANNFYGQPVYQQPRCLVRYGVARRLQAVQSLLEQEGLGLKIFDAYRPFSVQELFWAFCPQPDFLKEPVRDEEGRMVDGSKHSRGAAVDLTLVRSDGADLEMPTGFDEFSERAWRNYAGGSALSRANRDKLEKIMVAHDFIPLRSEWWHFDAVEWAEYDLLDVPL